jgi:diguanylate cyclase (GGDEF)-like protein/PAS domain S-box-containing protein
LAVLVPASRGGAPHLLLTLVLMGFALWLRLAIAPVEAGVQYVTFFPAVTIAAIVGGYRAGLLAAAIGLVLATVIFTPPYFSFSMEVLKASSWSNLAFLANGIIVSFSIEVMHRYRERYSRSLRQAEEARAVAMARKRRLTQILDNLFAYVALLDTDGVVREVNRAPLERSGYRRKDVVGKPFCDAPWWTYDEGVRAQLIEAIDAAKQGQTRRYDVVVKMGDSLVPIDFQISPVRDESDRIVGLLPTAVDITERKRAEEQLRIAAAAFETQVGVVVTDAKGVILRVNRALTEFSGFSAEEAIGQTPRLFKSGRHDADFYAAMWDRIVNTGSWEGEIWDRRKNGEVYPKWMTVTAVKGNDGVVTHYVSTHTDITERKAAEDEIRYLAFYDPLTQLPNRRLLLDRLHKALATSARRQRNGALLFIDLDQFKNLNDTIGHVQGDLLLCQVAERLVGSVREGDTVARLGGDEFVVMLEDLNVEISEAAGGAEIVGKKILAALGHSYLLDGHDYQGSASIGITLFGDQQESIEALLKQADLAMYQAKAAGRNTLRFFDPDMQDAVTARVALEKDLRKAVCERQFVIHYQAQVHGERRLTGAEALVRWQHPKRGLVFPEEFIAPAEEMGLIVPLGQWVIETVCAQLVAWAATETMAHLTISVNVSSREFRQPDFVEQVEAILNRTGADPSRLKLELTESLLVDDFEDAIAKMSALKARGVGFSLDDFGTGYSSLSYLKRLPLDQLKIDRSFIQDVLTDTNDAAIARTVVALAHSLGLSVIAEGVETEAQQDFLERQGCREFQGYLFSRPLPLEEFERFAARIHRGIACVVEERRAAEQRPLRPDPIPLSGTVTANG